MPCSDSMDKKLVLRMKGKSSFHLRLPFIYQETVWKELLLAAIGEGLQDCMAEGKLSPSLGSSTHTITLFYPFAAFKKGAK